MSTRETSIEAYKQIAGEGLLTDMGITVYAALFNHGPATANELREAVRASDNSLDKSIHKRLPELRDRGVVRETGKRPCKISGRTCIEWDVTSALPVKPESAKPYETGIVGFHGLEGPDGFGLSQTIRVEIDVPRDVWSKMKTPVRVRFL